MPLPKPPSVIGSFRALKDEYRGQGPRSDYAASTPSRFRRIRNGLYGSGDSHYANESEFIRTREYARDMDRNDSVIGMIINRATDNHVQTGFTPEPKTGDESIDKDLRQRFRDWAIDPSQCDIQGRQSFADIEWMAGRAELVDGDQFILPLASGHLQQREANLCRTPANTKQNVVHGILLDSYRRPQQVWFCPDNLNPFDRFEKVADARKYDVWDAEGERQVFHISAPTRPSQTRGVTALAPIFDTVGMTDDTQFATLVKQQMASCLTWFLERTNDYTADLQMGERQVLPIGDASTTATLEGVSPGMTVRGAKGEKLQALSPNIPSSEYFQHIKLLLTIIGNNLGLPLVVVLMDAEGSNFSGYRAAMDQAKIGWRKRQQRRKSQLHIPLWRWKVRQWLDEDPALRSASNKSTINIFRHDWQAPGWPYIQPLQDAEADALQMATLMASPTEIQSADGRNYDDTLRQLIRDHSNAIKQAIQAAQQIQIETKVAVNWWDVLHWDAPKGTRATENIEQDSIGGSNAPPPKGS